jgi:glycosyltransferase involved in cell wall biosynthesis
LGAKVEVASLDEPSAHHINAFPFPVHALGPGVFKYGYSLRFEAWLAQAASAFDVFIVNGIWQYNSYAAWKVLTRANKPYFLFLHGMLDPWFKDFYPIKHIKKTLYWRLFERRVLRDASAVLFTSEEERRLASRSFPQYECKEIVLGYGTMGAPAFSDTSHRDLDEFPSTRGKRIILFLGRLHEKKGLDILLKAYKSAIEALQSYVLLIVGPDHDAYRKKIRALATELGIADKVIFGEPQYGSNKWRLYDAAELFVLPSHQENFAIAVAESLSASTPVLITSKVNIWREVQTDGAGMVCEDNVHQLALALKEWASMSDLKKQHMRHLARACYERRFDIRVAGRKLFTLLSEATIKTAGKQ